MSHLTQNPKLPLLHACVPATSPLESSTWKSISYLSNLIPKTQWSKPNIFKSLNRWALPYPSRFLLLEIIARSEYVKAQDYKKGFLPSTSRLPKSNPPPKSQTRNALPTKAQEETYLAAPSRKTNIVKRSYLQTNLPFIYLHPTRTIAAVSLISGLIHDPKKQKKAQGGPLLPPFQSTKPSKLTTELPKIHSFPLST